MPHRIPALQVAERGVWWAPWLSDGLPVAVAVDSRGSIVGQEVLDPDADPAELVDQLKARLAEADPVTRRSSRSHV